MTLYQAFLTVVSAAPTAIMHVGWAAGVGIILVVIPVLLCVLSFAIMEDSIRTKTTKFRRGLGISLGASLLVITAILTATLMTWFYNNNINPFDYNSLIPHLKKPQLAEKAS